MLGLRDQFYEDVRSIFPEGDLEGAYDILTSIISREETDKDGNVFDYDRIITKFRLFHDSWNSKYSKKLERGFLDKKAEEARFTMFQFLAQGTYKQEFSTQVSNPERDRYLFGDNFNDLYKKVKEIDQNVHDI